MSLIWLRLKSPAYYIPLFQKWKPSVRFATGSSSFCLYATFLLHNYSCLCLATFLICLLWIVKAVAAQRCFAALTIQIGRFFINQAQARIIRCSGTFISRASAQPMVSFSYNPHILFLIAAIFFICGYGML